MSRIVFALGPATAIACLGVVIATPDQGRPGGPEKKTERPACPAPDEDRVLTGGRPAAEFFRDRAADKSGRCATREVEARVVRAAGRTEHWYVADGSCLYSVAPEAKRRAAFERLTRTALLIQPMRNGGPWFLEFRLVDPQSGELRPEARDWGRSPADAFLAIPGPVVGGQQIAYTAYARVEVTRDKEKCVIRFRSEREPAGFVPPRLPGRELALRDCWGMIYLNAGGYLRIAFGADVGGKLDFLKAPLRRDLTRSLVRVTELAGE